MSTPISQLDFLLALFRPLLTVQEAGYLLGDASDDFVISLIDGGALRAVDIATPAEAVGSDTRKRRALRIYRYTVEHRLIMPGTPWTPVPVETIFAHSRPMFRRDEVVNLLNCTAAHIGNLGQLLPGPRIALGTPGSSADRTPRHTREGVIAFLTSREIDPTI